jgi:TorA maturation chaperone TorD
MNGTDLGAEVGWIEEARERIYGFLAALFTHPDEGVWGRVLGAGAQKLAITTADALRDLAGRTPYPILDDELPCTELDLRFLVLDLCQPLEHLKGEYERVFCGDRPRRACSPYELDHRPEGDEDEYRTDFLAELALLYRSFGFRVDDHLPLRPDHIRFELEFMRWLLAQRRLAGRLAHVEAAAAVQVARYDLAERQFFSDHLSDWVPAFAARLRKYTGGGYCEPLGRFLAAWIPLERSWLGGEPRLEKNNCRREAVPAGT